MGPRIHEVRSDQNVPELQTYPDLREAARIHSQDTVENDYLSGTAPDGSTVEDRHEPVGYDCRLDIGGENYVTGGESIARQPTNGGEAAIAAAIVENWKDSMAPSETILRTDWRYHGVGVVVTEGNGTV